jgi:NADPH:quinone reductase-like Zn-dependent oxidoreductase
MFDLNLPS